MAKFRVGDMVKDKFGSMLRVVKTSASDQVVVEPVDPQRDGERHVESEKYLTAANSAIHSSNPVVQNALKARNDDIPEGWHRIGFGNFKNGDYLAIGNVVYKIIEPFRHSDEVKVNPVGGGMAETIDLLHAVGPLAKNSACSTIAKNAEDAGLVRALESAKESIGSALHRFNSINHGDVKWAQSVNRDCDDVARAINKATWTIRNQ